MRHVVFAVALLQAAAATAQIIGDEVVSDPLPIHTASVKVGAPAVTLAQDRSGVAIAWSMPAGPDPLERVYVARLDAAGRMAGAIREMPPATAVPSHQVQPSLAPAPGGDGFVLVWLELYRDVPSAVRAVFSRLDASLAPSPAMTFTAASATAPPLVRTRDNVTWLAAGGIVWPLAPDGTLAGPLTGPSASDMTIAGGQPQLVRGRSIKASFTCLSFALNTCRPPLAPPDFCYDSCRTYAIEYWLDYTDLRKTSVTKTFKFDSAAQPAIDSDGRDLLVAWFRGTQTSGGDVVAARTAIGDGLGFSAAADAPLILGRYPADVGETRPAIANDGQRYVVVWRSAKTVLDHDIVGAAIDGDGRVTPFAIATSTADERDPAILYAGGGRFLVAYEKGFGTERRIAARLVRFGRRRAAK